MFHVKHDLAPRALSLLSLALWGCPEGSNEPGVDAGPDTGMEQDMGEQGLAEVCEGECRTRDVTATFGEVTEPLEFGFYGLNAPAADGARSLYVELHGGGVDECPTMNSPTPSRTLVLSGLPWPLEARAYTSGEDGLSGALLDFEGTLFDGVAPARATAVEVTPRAASVCVECVGGAAPSDPGGFVAFDVSLTFEGGTLSGSTYVTHCDSYDE